MFRMPKKPAVERRPILRSMIKIDVDDMPRKLVEKPIPVTVAAPGELPYGAVDHIVLIVGRGAQRGPTAMPDSFMIGKKVAKIPPAVLVYNLPPVEEGIRAFNRDRKSTRLNSSHRT